jgi:hypothetical protein
MQLAPFSNLSDFFMQLTPFSNLFNDFLKPRLDHRWKLKRANSKFRIISTF